MIKTVRLTIFDETLRDGEQQVGIFFDVKTKRDLARLIIATGVHHVALMPAIHHTEASLVRDLVSEGISNLTASTMMGKKYIEESLECGVKTIILFNAVSDRLLCLRDPQSTQETSATDAGAIERVRQKMLDKILEHLKYAADRGLKICFAAEDASRADFDFLVACINKFQPYIEHFLLCDTVGVLTPENTRLWIRNLIEFTGNKASLAVHFHNDRGLALENTIQAILAGATGISGTFGGIGERAGNVAIEQVINGLKLRYSWQVAGINYQAMADVNSYLTSRGFYANAPYSPQSLRYETGIHVDSLHCDRSSYYIFTHGQPEVWFGKFSGASNFQYLFEHYLARPLPQKKYREFRDRIKNMAIAQRRSFSANEVLKLLEWQE